MSSPLHRTVAAGAATATVVAGLLALAPTARAAGTPPYEPDPQKVGGITFYNAAGQQITSGSINARPMAAYAVGDALPRSGDGKAVLVAAQPNPNAQTADWNTDYLSGFTSFPASTAPSNIASLDSSHPVVTGAASDLSIGAFATEFPNDPAHQSNAAYQNLYQIRLKTANGAGNQSTTYDVADVLVDPNAGTWTEVYPQNTQDTTPPSVTSIVTPSSLTAPATVTFSETVTGLTSGAVRLVVTGAGTVPTSTTCLSAGAVASCAGNFNAVRLSPTSPLIPGQHYTVVVDAGATHDLAGNASLASSTAFRSLTTLEENNSVVHPAWQLVHNKAAFGKSFVREHLAGASASWSFTGKSFTWWTVTGPDEGNAKVFVDGVRKLTVNNYAAASHLRVARVVKGLSSKSHTVRILVLGTKGSAKATDTFVAVDAFTVGKTVTATPVLSTTWRSITNSHLLAHHAVVADLAGETLTLVFRGTGITVTTVRGLAQGQASLFIDGVRKLTFDEYARATRYGVKHIISKLTDKVHTLKIVVLGKHHAGASGSTITVDRLGIA